MPAPGARLSLSDLAGAGHLILSTFVSQLEAVGVEVPGRRYVNPGSGAQGIVWDGAQLNVAFQTIHQGQPGMAYAGTQNPAAAVLFGQWAVLLLREIPIMRPDNAGRLRVPTAQQIDTAGQANLNDVSALAQAALSIHGQYLLTSPGVGLAIDEIVPMGPEAGLVGARLMFSASLT